ncbi:hypothetical protein [Vibrio cholerae]|nr:hypothetical protein [Vibrio cholerae]MDT8796768.1 hypothetical protein [Vibrio cholerae]MDT8830136.1 hypothetical protein [Vibrio cholerae]
MSMLCGGLAVSISQFNEAVSYFALCMLC